MTQKTQRLHITLRQLEVFVATAKAGSTRGAAEEVSRSQSAASTALVELESALGVRLFDRVGRRLALNENGQAFLPRAAALIDQAADAEALFSTAHAAPLRLASSFTIGEYLLPPLISQWKQAHPHSQVRLDIANTAEVLNALASFEVDIGFIEGARTHPELVVHRWLSDELVIIAAPSHPWVGRRVSAKQLAKATWIVREPGSGTRESSDRWLIPALGQVAVEMELGSNEAVKRAVASGLGLGCLSRRAVAEALAQGSLVLLKTPLPKLKRTLGIVVHKRKPLGSAAQDFLRHCMERGGSIDGASG
ncbi:MAG TPA: LysR family transcriptional regulator [Burkholderiaceae bacterium]|nr:LysR family transcriptional regulator [Burkholderiaceae bacterium]